MSQKKLGQYHFKTEYNEFIKLLSKSDNVTWNLLTPKEKMEYAGYLWSLGSDHDYHKNSQTHFTPTIFSLQTKQPRDKRKYPKETLIGKKNFRTHHNQYISKGFSFYKTNFDGSERYKQLVGRGSYAPDLMKFLNYVWTNGSTHSYHISKEPKYTSEYYDHGRHPLF